MACVKLGSKSDAFQRKGQAWFCTTGLPSDIVVEVGEMSFHLHKFPLLSRSGVMERLIAESNEGEEGSVISLSDLPGGAKMFELVANFCYGVKLELTASNVVYLRCVAEHLEMTEEYGEGNLIYQTETFLTQGVLKSWKESLRALQNCDDLLPYADQLQITKRCIESLAVKASTDPNLFGWPVVERGGPMQSPGGSVLWNGISTGARPKNSSSNWWYDDVSTLSFPLYKRLLTAMESRGIKPEIISGSVAYYAKRYLPGLNRRQGVGDSSSCLGPPSMTSPPSEEEQKLLVQGIDQLLPMQKGLVPTKFLFGLLRTAMILRADGTCISTLERRVGMQLDQANLEDLLMPNFSYSMETLYNVDCVQRILEHFLSMDQGDGDASPCSIDDAAQNERLPLRIIVQVLFFEQLQLRNSIAGCFLVSENLEGSRQLRSGLAGSTEGGCATAVRENQVLKVGMDNMRMRVSELEKECSNMRHEIEKLGRVKGSSTWGNVSKKLGFRLKSQMCSAEEGSVSNQSSVVSGKPEKLKERNGRRKKNL